MRATRSLSSRLLWAMTARTRASRHFTIRRLRSGLSAEGGTDLGEEWSPKWKSMPFVVVVSSRVDPNTRPAKPGCIRASACRAAEVFAVGNEESSSIVWVPCV